MPPVKAAEVRLALDASESTAFWAEPIFQLSSGETVSDELIPEFALVKPSGSLAIASDENVPGSFFGGDCWESPRGVIVTSKAAIAAIDIARGDLFLRISV
jgi:hypothetical protein